MTYPGEMGWIPVKKLRPDPDAIATVRDADQQRAYGVIDALGWYPPIVYNGHLDKMIWGEHIREALVQQNAEQALCLVVDLDEIEHAAAAIALHQQYGRIDNAALEARVLWLEREGFDTDYCGVPLYKLDQIRGERPPKERKPRIKNCPKCGAALEGDDHDH